MREGTHTFIALKNSIPVCARPLAWASKDTKKSCRLALQIFSHFPPPAKLTMASKANPSCLLLAWKLQAAFDLFVENPTKGGRVSQKNMGVVSKISHSEKGKVENKVDQAIFIEHNSSRGGRGPLRSSGGQAGL